MATREQRNSYIAGLFAGFAQTIVGHPFDTIKVRMQTGNFKSVQNCVQQTFHREGLKGFFAGISSPLASSIIFSSILFGSFDGFKTLFATGEGDQRRLSTLGFVAACTATGIVETTCYCPFEHIKTRLQTQYGGKDTLLTMVRQVYSHSGIRGIYAGYVAQLWRECPGNIVYFGSYTWAKTQFPKDFGESQRILLSGGFSGICYWFFTYPLDVVKSRMQVQSMDGPRKYQGFIDCVRVTYQELGIRGFFRGLTPCLVRAFPANAAAFGAFEYVKYHLDHTHLTI